MNPVKNSRVRRDKLLAAAEGYLALDMPQHALESLDGIEDPQRAPFKISLLRGLAFRHLEQHAAALKALLPAYEEDPNDLSLLLTMAWCYKRTNQLSLAISTLEHAYQTHAEEPIVLYNLSCYWTLAGNKVQALSWLGRALRMDQNLRKLIPHESDFDTLRHDPDFEMLIGLSGDISTST